jgi:hypothetical protein
LARLIAAALWLLAASANLTWQVPKRRQTQADLDFHGMFLRSDQDRPLVRRVLV